MSIRVVCRADAESPARRARLSRLLAVALLMACSGGNTLQDAAGDTPREGAAGDTSMSGDAQSDGAVGDTSTVDGGSDASTDASNVDATMDAPQPMDVLADARDGNVSIDVARPDVPLSDVVSPDVGPPTDVAVTDGGSCRAMNAAGMGACDRFFGYAWNGSSCVGISGCSCSGTDCSRLFTDLATCQAAATRCDCRITDCPGSQMCQPCRGVGGPVYVCLPSGVAC